MVRFSNGNGVSGTGRSRNAHSCGPPLTGEQIEHEEIVLAATEVVINALSVSVIRMRESVQVECGGSVQRLSELW